MPEASFISWKMALFLKRTSNAERLRLSLAYHLQQLTLHLQLLPSVDDGTFMVEDFHDVILGNSIVEHRPVNRTFLCAEGGNNTTLACKTKLLQRAFMLKLEFRLKQTVYETIRVHRVCT